MSKKRKYNTGGQIGSAVGSLIPIPGAGIIGGLLGSGIDNLINQDDEDQFEPQNLIKPTNPYINARPIAPRKYGGSLTQYQGSSHEEGGMDIGPAEVEGGENEFNMVVNSDTKKITKSHVNRFGIKNNGRVPIDKRHIGKTPAEVGEEIDTRYKKFYPMDPFNVSEKESLDALSDMSEELATEVKIDDLPFKRMGGRWTHTLQGGGKVEKGIRPALSKKEYAKAVMQSDYDEYLKGEKTGVLGHPKTGDDLPNDLSYDQYSGYIKKLNPFSQKHPRLNQLVTPLRSGKFNRLPYDEYKGNLENGGSISLSSNKARKMLRDNRSHGKTLSPKQKRFMGWVAGGRKKDGGGLFKDAEGNFKSESLLGMAPIAANLLQYGMEFGRKDEELNYPTIGTDDYIPLDPTQAVARVSEGFDNVIASSQRSGDLTKAEMIQTATQRGKAVGDVYTQFGNANIQGRNRQSVLNNATRRFNATQRTQAMTDNAANRGAGLTRKSAFLSAGATQAGQLGRDIRMTDAQERLFDRQEAFLERAYPYKFGKKTQSAGKAGTGLTTNSEDVISVPEIGGYNIEDYDLPFEDEVTYADLYKRGAPYSGR